MRLHSAANLDTDRLQLVTVDSTELDLLVKYRSSMASRFAIRQSIPANSIANCADAPFQMCYLPDRHTRNQRLDTDHPFLVAAPVPASTRYATNDIDHVH